MQCTLDIFVSYSKITVTDLLYSFDFNPDSYINSKSTKIPSCFSTTTATGALKVSKPKAWEERLKVLEFLVEHFITNIPTQEVTIEHLYYNGFHQLLTVNACASYCLTKLKTIL